MKFSLVIPCYNEADSLPMLFLSLKEVALKRELEIIIVDNGSTDDTQKILLSLIKDYSFITLVKVELNTGYGNGILAGLNIASGEIIGWTHADLQTSPNDFLKGIKLFEDSANYNKLFVKGRRYGRPFFDVIFTTFMSVFETFLLKTLLWDINAQPTLFHRSFYDKWANPPIDFSLDLFAYVLAKKEKLTIERFPVNFNKRVYGISSWNISVFAKYNFILKTIKYSFKLKKTINNHV